MEAARQAVDEFMAKVGHHDTTVSEKVAPAIVHETITRNEHEQLQTVVDKEIHQDHYHFSIQPINEEETKEEQRHHNLLAVEHRNFEHDDINEVQKILAEEAAKFRNEVVCIDGQKTSTVLAIIVGEHIHHHVHETIQPVVTKQTMEPHIIHTTIPIREVHHNAAQHHTTSSLPAVSMADFQKQGGILTGREERYDGFEGEPRSVGKALRDDSKSAGSQATPAPSPQAQQQGSRPSSTTS